MRSAPSSPAWSTRIILSMWGRGLPTSGLVFLASEHIHLRQILATGAAILICQSTGGTGNSFVCNPGGKGVPRGTRRGQLVNPVSALGKRRGKTKGNRGNQLASFGSCIELVRTPFCFRACLSLSIPSLPILLGICWAFLSTLNT